MADLIDRQVAINTVFSMCCRWDTDDPNDLKNMLLTAFQDLPSAQKVGKWIIATDSRGRHAECPYCGEWKYHSNQKFCGDCGALMKGEEDD